MRVAPKVTLTDAERMTLRRWARGRTTPMRLVRRAQIVLLAAEGKQNLEIAETRGIGRTVVGRWRRRFVEHRLAGLEKDAPRGGRPADTALARRIVEHTTQGKPPNATHWSTHSLAQALGTSRSTVSRVWRANGLKPHRMRTFKVSNDPQFVEKLIDVVGLYLIVDNYATHKHPQVQPWLKRYPRFHLHFTPTSSSWLNLVERWFREITDKRIRRGVFRSVQELTAAIEDYVAKHNDNPRSFTWTAKAETILEKVRRARAVLDKMQTA